MVCTSPEGSDRRRKTEKRSTLRPRSRCPAFRGRRRTAPDRPAGRDRRVARGRRPTAPGRLAGRDRRAARGRRRLARIGWLFPGSAGCPWSPPLGRAGRPLGRGHRQPGRGLAFDLAVVVTGLPVVAGLAVWVVRVPVILARLALVFARCLADGPPLPPPAAWCVRHRRSPRPSCRGRHADLREQFVCDMLRARRRPPANATPPVPIIEAARTAPATFARIRRLGRTEEVTAAEGTLEGVGSASIAAAMAATVARACRFVEVRRDLRPGHGSARRCRRTRARPLVQRAFEQGIGEFASLGSMSSGTSR